MNITLLVYGSLGDVQPYAALGAGLKSAGHSVTVAADPLFEPLIKRFGLSFAPVAGNPVDVINSEEARVALDSGVNPLRRLAAYRTFNRNFEKHLERNLSDSWIACRECDVFIFALNTFAGYHIAERLRIPSFGISIAPYTRTRTMPSIHFVAGPNLGSSGNLLTHSLTERVFFLPPIGPALNRWRKDSLGLPVLPFKGHLSRLAEASDVPVLYSYSPTLFPVPLDWPSWIHVTGYWFPEIDREWTPEEKLVDFLASGPAPVYIGFGSMSQADWILAKSRMRLIIEALDRANQRGIVSFGPNVPDDVSLPDNIFRAESVPHEWLFPQVSMTVHHGGSGTTSQSLRAGVPMLITPFMWDQPFWGHRVMSAGLGPKPIPHNKLNATNLGDAIRSVTTDRAMRARARAVATRVRQENGTERAVQIIDAYLGTQRSVRTSASRAAQAGSRIS